MLFLQYPANILLSSLALWHHQIVSFNTSILVQSPCFLVFISLKKEQNNIKRFFMVVEHNIICFDKLIGNLKSCVFILVYLVLKMTQWSWISHLELFRLLLFSECDIDFISFHKLSRYTVRLLSLFLVSTAIWWLYFSFGSRNKIDVLQKSYVVHCFVLKLPLTIIVTQETDFCDSHQSLEENHWNFRGYLSLQLVFENFWLIFSNECMLLLKILI